MSNLASYILIGIITGMLLNDLLTSPCKEGYVKINVIVSTAVCVQGYVKK